MTTLRDDISDDLCVCSIKPRQAMTHIVGCPVPKALAFAERAAGEARLEALEQALPAHKCGLYLTHNEHRDYYERLEQYLESRGDFFDDVFESPEARQRALDTDEMWHLQWYPDTPVGFFHVAAPTLKEVLARAAGCK